jgi:hypothetical protein
MRKVLLSALALGLVAGVGLAAQDNQLFNVQDLSLPVGSDPYFPPRATGEVLMTYEAPRVAEPIRAIHVVLATDKDAVGLGDSVRRDHAAMKDLFNRGFAGELQPIFHEFADGELTPRNMIRTIANLKLNERDALVVYFAGHGELVTTDEVVSTILNVNGPRQVFRSHHILKIGDEGLARANVHSAMDLTGARLKVLLADACRPLPPNTNPGRAPLNPNFKPLTALDTTRVNQAAFRGLFAFQSAFIDVSTGVALADPARGGVLTQCFVAACCYQQPTFTAQPRTHLPAALKGRPMRIAPTRIDRNGDDFVSWREFLPLWQHLITDYSGAEQSASLDIR